MDYSRRVLPTRAGTPHAFLSDTTQIATLVISSRKAPPKYSRLGITATGVSCGSEHSSSPQKFSDSAVSSSSLCYVKHRQILNKVLFYFYPVLVCSFLKIQLHSNSCPTSFTPRYRRKWLPTLKSPLLTSRCTSKAVNLFKTL